MIAYHIDRSGALNEGMEITLSAGSFDDELKTAMSDKLFDNQLSNHGFRFIQQQPPLDVISSSIEFEFELYRRFAFPNMPSRYQSFFALESLNDILLWPELLNANNMRVFQIEFDATSAKKLDASFLHSSFQSNNTYLSHITNYFAEKYWSETMSDSPKPELVISPPVSIGKQVQLCIKEI